jgi:hypothetical protein
MTTLKIIGDFEVNPKQRARFIAGELWKEWREKYPDLFDSDDERIAASQACHGFHFYEWLAAILIYHSTGYLALIEQYQFKIHKRKQTVLEKINSSPLNKLIADQRLPSVKFPDLLVYSPDFTDWFFCEVKGGADTLSDVQEQAFQKLAEDWNKPVCLIKFHLAKNTSEFDNVLME